MDFKMILCLCLRSLHFKKKKNFAFLSGLTAEVPDPSQIKSEVTKAVLLK